MLSGEGDIPAVSPAGTDVAEILSCTSYILFDEKLPGPLYGLPSVATGSIRQLMTSPNNQAETTDLGARQREFKLELLSVTALWNASLPIHTLPAEMLLQIFQHFLPSHPSFLAKTDGSKCPWTQLMCVCRHWCALIRNAGCFWRDVEARTQDVRWPSLALRRLGRAPARVVCTRNLKTTLPLLLEHAGHIAELNYRGSIHGSRVIALLRVQFPILDSLTLFLEPSLNTTTLPILSGSYPCLTNLILTRVSLSWETSILAGLEVLSLTDCQLSTPSLSFLDFLDVLAHGQKLRELRLTRFLAAALSPHTSISHLHLVTLPRLRHLVCHDAPAHVSRLMTHLHTPDISKLELIGEWADPEDPSAVGATLPCLLPQDITRVPILHSIYFVRLEVMSQTELYCTPGLPIDIRLSLLHPNFGDIARVAQQLPAVFGATVTELTLEGVLDCFTPATWAIVFEGFPALQKLATGNYNILPQLPTALLYSLQVPPMGTGYTVSDGGVGAKPARVYCPALRHLTISPVWWRPDIVEAILACLRFRAANGAARLEYLEFDTDVLASVDSTEVEEQDRARFRELVDVFVA